MTRTTSPRADTILPLWGDVFDSYVMKESMNEERVAEGRMGSRVGFRD